MVYVQQLESIPSNARLYNVYALNKPKKLGGQEMLIGTLQLNGKLTKSKWADENLFFRHQNVGDDLKIHPEWEPYFDKFSITSTCPFLAN